MTLLIPAAGPTGAAGTNGLDGATGSSLTRIPNRLIHLHLFQITMLLVQKSLTAFESANST